MSSYDDPDEARARRYEQPFSSHHPVPTIKKYREEQEERREQAEQHEEVEHSNEVEERFMHSADGDGTEQKGADGDAQEQQEAGAQQPQQDSQDPQDEDSKPMTDTSQADALAEDPRARRKELKKRKDNKATREVTDPVSKFRCEMRPHTIFLLAGHGACAVHPLLRYSYRAYHASI